jgi:hypothetical protein
MVKNGIYILKQDATVKGELKLQKDQEIGVSNDMIYMGGFPLDTRYQETMITWMASNLHLFIIDNRG